MQFMLNTPVFWRNIWGFSSLSWVPLRGKWVEEKGWEYDALLVMVPYYSRCSLGAHGLGRNHWPLSCHITQQPAGSTDRKEPLVCWFGLGPIGWFPPIYAWSWTPYPRCALLRAVLRKQSPFHTWKVRKVSNQSVYQRGPVHSNSWVSICTFPCSFFLFLFLNLFYFLAQWHAGS